MGDPPFGASTWELLIAALSGMGGGIVAFWRAAVLVGRAEQKLENLATEVTSHASEIAEIDAKNDTRHEENRRDQADLREKIAKLPDKEDFRRLEDLIRSRFFPSSAHR